MRCVRGMGDEPCPRVSETCLKASAYLVNSLATHSSGALSSHALIAFWASRDTDSTVGAVACPLAGNIGRAIELPDRSCARAVGTLTPSNAETNKRTINRSREAFFNSSWSEFAEGDIFAGDVTGIDDFLMADCPQRSQVDAQCPPLGTRPAEVVSF